MREAMHKRILSARKKLAEAELRLSEVTKEIQLACEHTQIAECEYVPDRHYGGVLVHPRRICLTCGMTEEGWSYVVLRTTAALPIRREDMYRQRQGLFIQEDVKGPLLRKEITVQELIRGS